MADIAVFHSVLGVRPGVLEAADILRGAGHRSATATAERRRHQDDADNRGADC